MPETAEEAAPAPAAEDPAPVKVEVEKSATEAPSPREKGREKRDSRDRDRDRDRRRDKDKDKDKDKDRDRDRDRRSRRRSRSSSRSRSRSRDRDRRRREKKDKKRDKKDKREKREKKEKKGKWDDMGSASATMGAAAGLMGAGSTPGTPAMMPAQLMALISQQMGMMPAQQVGSKKQRELYVGNLAMGVVTAEMLKETFTTLLQQVPEIGSAGAIVVDARLSGEGRFAFVEFRNEEIAQTAMQFAGMDLCGRPLKIGRPSGYVQPMNVVGAYNVPPAILGALGASGVGAATSAADAATKKQRELYVGNLATGMVTGAMLKELFTAPLLTLPGVDATAGPPVISVSMDASGQFGFVEFSTNELSDTALELFNNMELCGRSMRVGRPTGWVDPKAPAGMGMMGMMGMAGGMGGMGMAGMQGMQGMQGMAAMGMTGMMGMAAGGMAGMMGMAGNAALMAGGAPTTCLLLENLVQEDMLKDDVEYADVSEDIREECASKGQVLKVLIPRTGDNVGKAYVQFADAADAAKAFQSLNGRSFAQNVVKVSYIQEADIPGDSMEGAAPTEAAPTEAVPTESAPTESAPTEAALTEAVPTEAVPAAEAAPAAPAAAGDMD